MQPARAPDTNTLSRYLVQSSDVLSDMRVNVSEEGVQGVIWYKERFLADEEIVEHLVENATSTIMWTIHRPKRGWYIRLRTPAFPPGVFISLLPLPQSSPYHADAALTFACRTNPPSYSLSNSPLTSSGLKRSLDSDVTQIGEPAVHSYPPTPPPQGLTVLVHPPSPRLVQAKLEEIAPTQSIPRRRPPPLVQPAITHFLLTPHSAAHIPQPPESASIFSRVMTAFKNNAPSHSNSFTLSPVSMPALTSPTPPSSLSSAGGQTFVAAPVPTPVPILTFHDRTPVYTVRSNFGVIEIDKLLERSFGVATSFYIAVALTYLEFLADRESYLAALGD
ncbi:hypothetical protein SCP_1002590 [Sparassis crispa]|uniref:Uncharacterized protein n=1 Tax=Sparassis crispa TaxID=139825 RepID=A0A401GXT7_9APHY|nr:hypothetical protein SCP_1002590 [Sparassis crispa]GBE87013.1 hypothetical protein SCP_1002590 [Sparassis crispa]